jgi:hypothetical protein
VRIGAGVAASIRHDHFILSLASSQQAATREDLIKPLSASRVQVLDGVAVRRNPAAASPESIIDPQTGRPGMRITSFDGSGAELASTTSEVAEFLLGMTSGPHDGASAEGTHVGYRGWYGSGVEPAFWFGAGLGLGVWHYRSAEQLCDSDGEPVTVILANKAERPSTEVVQVYWLPGGPARYGWWVIPSPTKSCLARSVRSQSLVIRAHSGCGTNRPLTESTIRRHIPHRSRSRRHPPRGSPP